MYNSKNRSSSTSRKSPEYRIRPWLRARIHPYCWGQSDRNKKHFRQTKKQRVFGLFHSLRSEGSRRYLPRITNDMMIDHFLGRVILYFQADGRYKAEETLIEIDIDCHARGSYAGACECVEWLIANGFPGLFGRGQPTAKAYVLTYVLTREAMVTIDSTRSWEILNDGSNINIMSRVGTSRTSRSRLAHRSSSGDTPNMKWFFRLYSA
jgi:hypothetical protein